MGRRSKIDLLPKAVREELERHFAAGDFAKDEALFALLKADGYDISRSSVQRRRQRFEEHLAALRLMTEESAAIVAVARDDEGQVNDALVRLVQSKLQGVLIELDLDTPNLTKIARAVADLGRASVGQKRWAQEMRARLEKEKVAAAAKIGQVTKAAGLSDAAEAKIRAVLFGIDPLRRPPTQTASGDNQNAE